jgi:predicted nucleic acid-binding protein
MLLDTNIISEVMRAQPNQQVIDWLNRQSVQSCFNLIPIANIVYSQR